MNKNPTKQDEISILRDCADKLGANSYCGPWLSQQIPFVESAIRSDFFPDVDLNKTRELCAEEARRCAEACETQRKIAQKEADAIIANARKEACAIRGRLLQEIRNCQKELGVSF